MTKKKVFSTWIEPELLQSVTNLCASLGITKADYMRSLILRDLGEKTTIRANARHTVPLKNREHPPKESPDDFFRIDPKKEAEWKRRMGYKKPY